MWFFYFCITISYITSLLNVNSQAIPVDIGNFIKPMPVRHNVIELDFGAIKTNVSNPFINVVNTFFSKNIFGFMIFVFKVGHHFCNVIKGGIKTT